MLNERRELRCFVMRIGFAATYLFICVLDAREAL